MSNKTVLFDQNENDSEDSFGYEVYMTDGDIVESEDGLVWKEILREGTWPYRPGPDHKPLKKPLSIITGNAENSDQIGMADLIEAFYDEAIDHVTIPTSHDDKPHENTGYIRELKQGVRNGRQVLMAGLEFTEPDIAEKAKRGSIANTSAGIIAGYINKFTGKMYKYALGHVALTNKPWINGMVPFGANSDLSEDTIVPVLLEDFEQEESSEESDTDETFVESSESEAHEEAVVEASEDNSEEVIAEETDEVETTESKGADLSADDEGNKGGNTMSESSTESVESDATTELSEDTTATLLSEQDTKFSDELAKRDAEIEKLRSEVHKAKVEDSIEELKTMGFSEFPGLLTVVRDIYLADEKQAEVISLSEEGAEVSLTASDIVDRVIKALPTEKMLEHSLSDFAPMDDKNRPGVSLSDSERGEKLAESLGIDLPKEGDN